VAPRVKQVCVVYAQKGLLSMKRMLNPELLTSTMVVRLYCFHKEGFLRQSFGTPPAFRGTPVSRPKDVQTSAIGGSSERQPQQHRPTFMPAVSWLIARAPCSPDAEGRARSNAACAVCRNEARASMRVALRDRRSIPRDEHRKMVPATRRPARRCLRCEVARKREKRVVRVAKAQPGGARSAYRAVGSGA